MLERGLFLAVLGGLATGFLSTSVPASAGSVRALPPEAREIASEVAELAGAIEDLDEEDPQEVFRVGRELSRAEASAGYYALAEKWDTIHDPGVRQQFIQMFGGARLGDAQNRLQKRLAEAMDLGVRDPAPLVQVAALRTIKQLSLRDFAEDISGYDEWFGSVKGKDANQTLAAAAEEWVTRSSKAKGAEVRKVVEFFEEAGHLMMEIEASRAAAMKAGWAKMLAAWLTSDDIAAQAAMRLSSSVKFRKRELQDVILPLAKREGGGNLAVRGWAVAVLGDGKATWAVDDLLAIFKETFDKEADLRAFLGPMSRALAAIGDAKAIPVLIAAAEAEGSPAAMNTVGQYGLAPLTGVKQTEERDAAWWRAWWQKNRHRYGDAMKATEIPSILTEEQRAEAEAKAAKEREQRAAEAELKDVPAAMVAAGYDNDRRYNFIGYRPGKSEPEGGFRLLLILPGGDGSAEFKAFCQRIWKNALDDKWVVAQLIAPKWDEAQAEVNVWPTKGAPYKAARFTTEDLVESVIADVKQRCELNPKHVYVLAWSSGGPAAYSLMLRKKPETPIAGAFIAMSVFKPEQTEGLKNAKGGKFFLLHSPDDAVTPITSANEAKESLTKSGATVELKTYEGGHGWKGDVYGNIKSGLEWLAK